MKTIPHALVAAAFRHRSAPGLIVAALIAGSGMAQAKICTWSGGSGSSGAWDSTANWSGGAYPINGDDVVFPLTASRKVNTNVFTKLRLNSITFSGAGYEIRGNAIILSDGVDSTAVGSVNTIDLNIDLGASQTFDCSSGTAALYLNGELDLGSYTLTMMGPGAVRITGVISGTGGMTKTGTGTHWLQGSSANTYTGPTLVGNGTLMLAKPGGHSVEHGSLTVGNGVGGADTAIVRELGDYQIGTIPITINEDGWLDLDAYDDTVGAISFHGGRAGTTTGTLILGGDVTMADQVSEIYGRLSLGTGTRVFDVGLARDVIVISPDLHVSADVSGSAHLVKEGMGVLLLDGDNTYSGTTTVESSILLVESPTALGSPSGGTTVEAYCWIWLGPFSSTSMHFSEPLQLAGRLLSGASGSGVSNSCSGAVTLGGMAEVLMPAGTLLNLTGAVGGSGGFTVDGDGTLILSGTDPNTFIGDTIVNAGTLQLQKDPAQGALPGPGDLFVGNESGSDNEAVVRWGRSVQVDESVAIHVLPSGHADLDDHSDSIGDIFLNSAVLDTGSGTVTLVGDAAATEWTNRPPASLSGNLALTPGVHTFQVTNTFPNSALLILGARVSGPGDLRKAGHGRLWMGSINTYAGATTVAEGGLYVWSDDALGSAAAGTVVEDGGSLHLLAVDVVEEPLTLHGTGHGDGALVHGIPLGSNSWAGPITLATDVLINVPDNVSNLTTLTGIINGPGSLTKTGEGVLMLTGPNGNTYGGDTIVEEGTLVMGRSGGQSVPHSLVIGGNDPGDPSAFAVHAASDEIFDHVTVNASGFYDLDGWNEAIRNLNLNGGADVDSGAGTLTLVDDLNVDPLGFTGAVSTVSGNLEVSSDPCTLTVPQSLNTGFNNSELVIEAIVSGSQEIIKEGEGELQLNEANTFAGPFTINNGGLRLNDNQGLGATSAGTTVNGDAYLQIHTSAYLIQDEPLVLNSTYGGWGALYALGGSNVWTGGIALQIDSAVGVLTGSTLNVTGAISGPGDLRKVNDGTVILSGADPNTYTGDTYVDRGALLLDKTVANSAIIGDLFIGDGAGGADADVVRLLSGSEIGSDTRIVVADSGLFDLNNVAEYFGSLAGSGHVTLGSGNLRTGADNTSTTFSGLIEGTGELHKFGSGVFTLAGDNAYSGDTVIYGGTLLANGSQPGSDVEVTSSGTLGGIGTVGDVFSSGTVAPGSSVGELGCGKTALQAGSTFDVELDGHTPVDYDRLDVNGSTSIDNADLAVSWGFVPAVGDAFTIIENHGPDPVFGTFNGLPDGASLTADNVVLKITYNGGDGNDVVLAAAEVTALEDLRFRSIGRSGGDAVLQWAGGVPFYQVNRKVDMGTNTLWQPVGPATRDFEAPVPLNTDEGYYQVIDGN